MKKQIVILFLILLNLGLFAQNRSEYIRSELEMLSIEMPGLNEELEVTVSNVPLAEYLRTIAQMYELNLDVNENLTDPVVNNFYGVEVIDVLMFLMDEYDLDIRIYGSIISISRYNRVEIPKVQPPKDICIVYSSENRVLTLELDGDSLGKVCRSITQLTGEQVIASPEVYNLPVDGFYLNVNVNTALTLLAQGNGLELILDTIQDQTYYKLQKEVPEPKNTNLSNRRNNAVVENYPFEVRKVSDTLVSIASNGQSIQDVIRAAAQELGVSYLIIGNLEGEIGFKIDSISFEQLLERTLNRSEYAYSKNNGVYFIGSSKLDMLKHTEVYLFNHRTAEDVLEIIPKTLKGQLEVLLYVEQNGIIISGSQKEVQNLISFFKEVDVSVPMVFIEIIIIDYNKSATITAGVEMGLGDSPAQSGGQVFPGVDYTLDANTLNAMLQSFNGFGTVNLGGVSENFYMRIQALEDNGIVKIRSTPNLSTLNGHTASLKIGSTEYYVIENANIIGVQNPQSVVTRQYQSVQADLSIEITPIVSADNQVTLNITVSQSDFTTRITPEAPPGQVNRSFESSIRVKNDDVILLGGLEEKRVNDNGSGVPLLARIPVIKWLFSTRTRSKDKTKLNIFIKPTILR